MTDELTEADMRRALFGDVDAPAPAQVELPGAMGAIPDVMIVPPVPVVKKRKAAFGPRLRVTLQVGHDFEGQRYERIHEADTLSTLVAEQEAVKAARKKFRYVEVVSVEPV
ncbi:hypothetical protein [Pseudomonas sp. Marseille-Q5115]|uniref:hypothetical protein n=1 Tax=Pseudomonas sp. Marseille-Q5115 TaxID=2866593 RepID=UPI001CE44BBF|nr:hypothetical protein [Pseudomonas sp. Marseille-Q5115]